MSHKLHKPGRWLDLPHQPQCADSKLLPSCKLCHRSLVCIKKSILFSILHNQALAGKLTKKC